MEVIPVAATNTDEHKAARTARLANHMTYPRNLKSTRFPPVLLRRYERHIQTLQASLFDPKSAGLSILDQRLNKKGNGLVEINEQLFDRPDKLYHFLEKSSSEDDQNVPFRAIFLRMNHTNGHLELDKSMLLMTLSIYEVHLPYLDSIFDLHHSKKLDQPMIGQFHSDTYEQDRFQISYSLTTCVRASDDSVSAFSPAPVTTVIHHQYDPNSQRACWIFTSVDEDVENLMAEHLVFDARDNKVSSFHDRNLRIHIMLLHAVASPWRWYLNDLESAILNELNVKQSATTDESARPVRSQLESLRLLSAWELQLRDVVALIERNVLTITQLINFYLKSHEISHIRKWESEGDCVVATLSAQVSRAQRILTILHERKGLLSSQFQGQSAQKAENLVLNVLKISFLSQTYMRAIGVAILIFIPAIFVSTFFSTDIVTYTDVTTVYSSTALRTWLAVTFPLTTVTIFACFVSFRYSSLTYLSKRFWMRLTTRRMRVRIGDGATNEMA